jgi:hypothetical protein
LPAAPVAGAVAMRLLALAVAAVLLPFAAAPAAADSPVPDGPTCPLIADLLTLCVGGSLDCFVYVRTMGGDRHCL